jgi:hypothetical protein
MLREVPTELPEALEENIPVALSKGSYEYEPCAQLLSPGLTTLWPHKLAELCEQP